jgi:hypothetical protein
MEMTFGGTSGNSCLAMEFGVQWDIKSQPQVTLNQNCGSTNFNSSLSISMQNSNLETKVESKLSDELEEPGLPT